MHVDQRGNVHVFLTILTIIGLVVATYLVQQKTNLFSKAASPKKAITQFTDSQINAGTGALSGTHYNLNIIGVPKAKTASLTDSSGHRIFIPLEGKCKINLSMGAFQVLDGNCTDGPATLQLPNPNPENDGATIYSVWARVLGKPDRQSAVNTCATYTNSETGIVEDYCSIYSVISVREKGKASFADVSKQLLYVYADLDDDGEIERYPLFDSALEDYYWSYDNQGMKIMQLRFYPISTPVAL